VSHLATARVLLEACPPAENDREKAYAVLKQGFTCYNSFHAVSIPDLQDAGEFQRVRQRVTNDEFAAYLGQLTEKPISLYKVCASCTEPEFRNWLDQAEALGCGDIFLVGPDSSSRKISNDRMGVPEAAKVARERGFRCGGIIIPTRRRQFAARPASLDETDRLLLKVRDHGLRFFTTQILYEGEWMSCLLLDLVRQMSLEELPQIFLTFSPFVCAEDLTFSRKTLGVYIPTDVGRMLRGSRSMREASIAHSLLLWERISAFASEIGYPSDRLGVNVEYLDSRNPRNVDAAFELAEEFGRVLRRR
jgi:5,10-methylenetetrahydrofolate reductase